MDANGLEPEQWVPASRKLGRDTAGALAAVAKKLIVAKGKNIADFAVGSASSEEAINAMLGPTGNLRAPTLQAGDTLLVGFNEERYREVLLN